MVEDWNNWKDGFKRMSERTNINRGYQKLIVWQDAADLYVMEN
jgi:hypothetical protein